MGSMGSRSSWVWFAASLLACAVACAPRQAPPTAAASPTPPATAPDQAISPEQLPQGPGRQILANACTSCHNLREVTKFNGFYSRVQWRDIVLTMMDYGAPVNEKEVEVLTAYLTEHLGKK
jgi:cytochrome c5